MKIKDRTNIFYVCFIAGDRSNFPNVVILISDGFHTMDTDDTEPLANQLKESGAYIITIGTTYSNNTSVHNKRFIAVFFISEF